MNYLKKVSAALHTASIDTSRLMSAKLRSEARASGWPDDVTRGLHVRYEDGKFNVYSHPEHRDQVLNLEYGVPGTQPTAAIRRFNNRQHESEKFLINHVRHQLRGRV